ncbi:hypothetical protein ACFV2H_11130 [Streptomyces sp. NPDC059629]
MRARHVVLPQLVVRVDGEFLLADHLLAYTNSAGNLICYRRFAK